MEKFIERLKELRAQKGLSQAQLAKATGLSQSAITYWETGKRIPNAYAVIILARFFDVSTDYLSEIIEELNDQDMLKSQRISDLEKRIEKLENPDKKD